MLSAASFQTTALRFVCESSTASHARTARYTICRQGVSDPLPMFCLAAGATAVCIVCYVIPVFIHFKLVHAQAALRHAQAHGVTRAPAGVDASCADGRGHSGGIVPAPASDGGGRCADGAGCAGPPAAAPAATAAELLAAHAGAEAGKTSGNVRWDWRMAWELLDAAFILCLGVGFSLAALFVAVQQLLGTPAAGA